MKSSRLLLAATLALCLTSSVTAVWSSSMSERMSRASKQVEKKDYEGAVASYTEILSENPSAADAYLKRADARLQLKDFDGAMSDYDQAIKVNSNFVESYVKRADLKVRLGDPQSAITDYSEALRLNPKDAVAHTNRAIAYKLNGDFAKAADDCTWALNADPNALDALEERADCKLKANNLDGAIADYKALFKKNKSKASHLNYNMGRALMLKGNKAEAREYFDDAIEYHSKALKNSHKNAEDYMKRGLTYIEMQEPDKAVDDFENAIAIAPDDAIAHYQLGHLRLAMGDNKKAVEQLSASLKIDPKQNPALLDRAAAYVNLGDFALAQKDLDNALITEKGADVLLSRALARLGMGDSSGAAADVQEALNISPKSVDSKKDSLASLVASKENHHDLDVAMSQNLEQLALLEMTSNVAAAESLVKRAIEIQEKSLEKGDPKLAYSLMLLGRVQLKKNDPLKAEALFRSALLSLKHNSDGTQKYAIFNLEDCARLLLQSGSLEKAGAILSDTRMTRAMLGINERPLVGDTSRRAERAIEAFRLKKKNEQELANGKEPEVGSYTRSSSSSSSTSSLTTGGFRTAASSTSAPSSSTAAASPVVASAASSLSAERAQSNSSNNNNNNNNNNKPLRDKWALIVGISNFKDSNINLHYPAKDAKDFADFLVKEKNFAPDHVKLLTDKIATRANILSMLGNKWLPRVAAPDDLVVIYFSGHGSSSSLDVGGVNYLVAHDTDVNDLYSTAIAMQDLTRIIKDRVHSERVMIVLDACHSGAVAPNAKGLARPSNVDIDPIVQGTGQLVISSSSPEQQSWESTRYQGSVFTKHLIDGLRKNGKMTNLGDAYGYLDQAVQNEVLRDRGMLQNPVMKSRWEGRDLVIGVPPASPTKGLNDFDLPDSGKLADESNSAGKAKPHAATKPKAKGSFAKRVK
ncbi:MAG: tetratricopeptide repeat protein [Cyanobacteria bacterium SZAS-4]|nr:tetratricopeptide repeat protein [Cyanobacteria bacterium SZAS-4]